MVRLAAATITLLLISLPASGIDPMLADPGDGRGQALLQQAVEDSTHAQRDASVDDHDHDPDAADDAAHDDEADHAEHEAPPLLSVNLGSAVWNLIIFLVLVAILGKFVWPKILEGLRSREQKIHDDLVGAEKANAEAKRTLAEYEQKLAESQAEARKLLEQARADAEQLKSRLADETEQELARLRQRATEDINRAKRQALQDLSAHAADLAVDVAGRILQRQIDASDTDRLVQQSLEELENARGN